MLKDFAPPVLLPNLVVDSLLASSNAITVVIRNEGPGQVTDAFWVETYVNPTAPPTGPNQEWHTRGSEAGLVWGITTLPIAAGQSLTLTLTSPAFVPEQSSPTPLTLSAGSRVYAQVDSANTGVATGAVLEGNETDNITGPVLSTVSSEPGVTINQVSTSTGLPPRLKQP